MGNFIHYNLKNYFFYLVTKVHNTRYNSMNSMLGV